MPDPGPGNPNCALRIVYAEPDSAGAGYFVLPLFELLAAHCHVAELTL